MVPGNQGSLCESGYPVDIKVSLRTRVLPEYHIPKNKLYFFDVGGRENFGITLIFKDYPEFQGHPRQETRLTTLMARMRITETVIGVLGTVKRKQNHKNFFGVGGMNQSCGLVPTIEVIRKAMGNQITETPILDVNGGNREISSEVAARQTLSKANLKQIFLRFKTYLKGAKMFRDRMPLRRPKREISKVPLQNGNDLIRMPEQFSQGQRYLSWLRVKVNAVARAIASLGQHRNDGFTLSKLLEFRGARLSSIENKVRRDKRYGSGESERPSRKYFELAEVQGLANNIKSLKATKRQLGVSRQGALYLARERLDRDTTKVPVTSICKFWKPIVATGSSNTSGKAPEPTEAEWKEIFRKAKVFLPQHPI
ncbi:unnamed protein product [Strongylus vulgaris]|uniref:Uncharacterized protein n=1 Tax=Strongylus vulgaris TaxID=40348 RepID=A0A3P7HXL8_STRVU|nr:unnamed protein product [Strongylus vulgaris]